MKKLTSMAWVLPLVAAPAFMSGCGPVNADLEATNDAKIVEEAPVAPAEMPVPPKMEEMKRPMMAARNVNVGEVVQLPDAYASKPGTYTRNPTVHTADEQFRAYNRNIHVYQTNIVRDHLHNNTNIHTNLNTNIINHPRLIHTSGMSQSYTFSNSNTMSETTEPVEVINAQETYATPYYRAYGWPYYPRYAYGLGFGFRHGFCSPYYGNCSLKAARYGFAF